MPFLIQGKTNWKYILIVVILASVVSVGILDLVKREEFPFVELSVIKKSEKKVEDEITKWRIYKNEKYGYEIKYPEKWLVKKEELGPIYSELITQQIEPLDQIKFVSSKDSQKSVVIIIHNNSKGYSLEEWLRVYREITPTEVSLSWKEEFSIAGEKGLRGGFGCCMTFRQAAFLAKGNKIYQVEGGLRNFETKSYRYEAIFDQMLSTFKFLK